MRVGFRFYTNTGPLTLWTTILPGHGAQPSSWGRIVKATVSYADMQISEAKVTFAAPNDRFIRSILAVCVPEATPLDLGLDVLCGSLWVQDVRFGYEPQPLFYGNILSVEDGFAPGGRTCTVTLHDFRRLINLQRDLQDYQNLTDDSIMQMLAMRLNEVLAQDGVQIGMVSVDQEALARVRRTSTGAIRQYNSRSQGRMLHASELDKMRAAARALGFTFRVDTIRNPRDPDDTYQKFTLLPIGGSLEKAAGTYRYGDGEVISFAPRYTPPSGVLQRDVMNKRFDAVNEILQLENAAACVELDKEGIARGKDGGILARDAITAPTMLTDAEGRPVSLGEYQQTTRPTFIEGLRLLGGDSTADLWKYHDRIALRKGLLAPGSAPSPIQQSGPGGATDYMGFVESSQETGELFWRFTGRLQTRFNPLLTTTDYLEMAGFGVWDGVWGIRSFTHEIGAHSMTNWDLTFGAASKNM